MRIVGIDIGSRSVKIILMDDGIITTRKYFDTSLFYREFCENIDKSLVVNFDKLGVPKFDGVVSTGYGRNNISINGAKIIIELKAHVLGAIYQTKLESFILLDIGGQDSKVVLVKNKKMVDMVLNDKCAASCGRFLENMANVLGISIGEMFKFTDEPVEINSTCAVFAESELIGRIAEGFSIEKLSAGVNFSLFRRIRPMLEKFKESTLVVTGGVAFNSALINFIKEDLKFNEVLVPKDPQFNGAIGCAILLD